MFVRFVVHKNDKDSGRRQGLFQAIAGLEREGVLFEYEQSQHDEIYKWFKKNLKKPRRFTRSSKPHAKHVALSWFKDTALENITKMHVLAQILKAHEVEVEVLRTERPGYIVYEDAFQVAAEPFKETTT